jgi:hypothetical protein
MAAKYKLRGLFARASGDEFHRMVTEVLSDLMPNIASARRLGELDRQGIDSYQYKSETFDGTLAIQCKGFEKPEFGKDQLRQCLAEIAKFAKRPEGVEAYWLVLNRPVKEAGFRSRLSAALASLRDSGKAKEAELFDLERFTSHLRSLATARLNSLANDRRSALQSFYKSSLEFVDYIPDVPFLRGPKVSVGVVPELLSIVTDFYRSVPNNQAGRDRAAPRILLTSSFGFGKTSALHAFAAEWTNRGNRVLYVPAGLLSAQAFTNSAGLALSLLATILPQELSELATIEFRTALKRDVGNSDSWVLLLDALDENARAFDHERLSALCGGLKDLGLPVIATVRDELFRLRSAEFQLQPAAKEPFFQTLSLCDWDVPLILAFLVKYATRQGQDWPAAFRGLYDAVKNGSYEAEFGDIPKRPLFLGMLAEDAWRGDAPERHLHRLYGKYFRNKFMRDRFSGSAEGQVLRHSVIASTLGFEEARERVVGLMQGLSATMARWDVYLSATGSLKEEAIVLDDFVTEDVIERCAADSGLSWSAIEDVMLHSLLFPVGRDPRTNRRRFRFAHRSYQEWFYARYLAANADNGGESHDLPPSVVRFLKPMVADLASGKSLP